MQDLTPRRFATHPEKQKSYLQCLRTGLIRQPVQIAAALRWRDLTLFVRFLGLRLALALLNHLNQYVLLVEYHYDMLRST